MSQAITLPDKLASLLGRRIVFVVNDCSFLLSHRLALAKNCKDLGMEVFVVAPSNTGEQNLDRFGFFFKPWALKRWSSNPLNEIHSLISLIRLYRKIKPDIVHHITIKPVIYGSLAARFSRVRCVVNAVSGLGFVFLASGAGAACRRWIATLLYRTALAHSQQITIFQNPDDRKDFIRARLIESSRTIVIRGSGVDPKVHEPLPLPPAPFIVLMIARLLREKGIREFFEAASRVRNAGAEVSFRLVGEYPEGNPGAIERDLLIRLEKGDPVHWLGFLTDIRSQIGQSHVVCLPSYREGLPRALIEAAACGRAIITTNVPGCREIAIPGRNGFLVQPQNVEQLASTILQCAHLFRNAPTAFAEMGNQSRILFLEGGFTDEAVVSATLKAYTELLHSSSK